MWLKLRTSLNITEFQKHGPEVEKSVFQELSGAYLGVRCALWIPTLFGILFGSVIFCIGRQE